MAYEKVPTRKKGRWCTREEAKLAASRTRRQEDKKEVEYFEEDVMSQRNIDDDEEFDRIYDMLSRCQTELQRQKPIIEAAVAAKVELRAYCDRHRELFGYSNPYHVHRFETLLDAIEAYEKEQG